MTIVMTADITMATIRIEGLPIILTCNSWRILCFSVGIRGASAVCYARIRKITLASKPSAHLRSVRRPTLKQILLATLSTSIPRRTIPLSLAVHVGGRTMAAFRSISTLRICTFSIWIAVLVGCSQEEGLRRYTIDHRAPAAFQTKTRMLGAIVPQTDANWFFKITGPEESVEEISGKVQDFVRDVRFRNGQPEYDIPSDWQEVSPGTGPFAPFAKFTIEAANNQMDLTVTRLGRGDDWDSEVQANVNRWRGQMGLEPSQERWAGALPLMEDKAEGSVAVWVDLIGDPAATTGGVMSPATPAGNQTPVSRAADGAAPQVSGNPADLSGDMDSVVPPTAPPNASAGADGRLNYRVPQGWRDLPASGMRLATLESGEGDALVTVTMIRAGGDLSSNVAMWIGQVGRQPNDSVTSEAIESAEELTIAGLSAKRIFLEADQEEGEAIDVVVVESSDALPLFIKMKGPRDRVIEERSALTLLVESLHFGDTPTKDSDTKGDDAE